MTVTFFAESNYSRASNAASDSDAENGIFLLSSFTSPDNEKIFSATLKTGAKRNVKKVKTGVAAPNIKASAATGVISACVGSPSVSTQQFTVSGSNLTDNITVTAPAGFEISINPAGGFTNMFFMVATGSSVTSRVVYVRSIAAGTPANLSGVVTLTTAGGTTKKVAVKGVVYALPTVDPISDLIFTNGDLTTPINFTGTGNTFYWTNDKPRIGLVASGSDNIAPFTAVNTGSSPLVAHISATSRKANIAYVPDYGSNTVLAVNTITNEIVSTIPVGANPGFVEVSPDGKKVYIANVSGTSLSIINTQTNQARDISIFDNPTALIFSKDGTRAYVAGETGECTVIDVANDAVLTALTFPSGGAGIALSDDGKWIYATNSANGDIRVYDTANNAESINIPARGAHYAATSPDGKKIYFTGSYSNTVYVIDVATNTLSATIDLIADAEGIAISPDGSRIYVTNQSAGTVTVINAANNSVMTALPVGKSPRGIAITPDGKYVYVANADSGTLSVISTSDYTIAATIPCGIFPYAIGNFITPGENTCLSNPTDFKITVNPSPTTITPGTVGGLITTCIGAPSTNFQQFTVSGNNLSGNIKAASPAGLEISFSKTSGFADVLNIAPTGGAVTNKVIYVRAKASGTPANLSGNVVLSTTGAASKNVAVKGVVNDLPTTDAADNPVYNNGDITAAIKFTGTANTYTWTNDKPSIGLAASGTGDIPSFTAINTGIPPVKANITVTPSSDGYLYLAGANNMILVDADENKQTGTINTGGQPIGTAISPDGTLVAITDYTANTVKFINTTTHKVVSTVNNVSTPIGICFTPDGKKVYVANENTFNVTIIDVATATAGPPFHVGVYPYGIAASPDGNTVYVGCTGENAVVAIDTKTYQTTPIKVNFGPTGIAVSPDNSRVYATSAQYNGLLKVIDVATKSVLANIPVGDVSTGICVSPDGKRVYISNTQSNNVMVIDAEINKVIATIPTDNHPFGVSITPDGKYVYVANEGSNSVNIINTATNSITNGINITGQLSKSFGNFFVPGTGCTGTPTKFTITVNGSSVITASAVTGEISACTGSSSINTQQFKVSGSNLSADITVTAPAKFEVSLSETGGFANSVVIAQTGGIVTDQIVYVRSAASATAGNISGDVVLSSVGLTDKKVTVRGLIHSLPAANQISDQGFDNSATTTVIHFTGIATTYTWTNDNPSIGLPGGGSGDIPSFTAVNNSQAVVTATITVVPSDASCEGNPMTFKININPTIPTLTSSPVTGNITACQGSPSASPNIQQFAVEGTNLTGDVQITAPANFEVSFNPNTGYAGTLKLTPIAGKVNSTDIYIRSAATAPVGHLSGNIVLSSAGITDQNIPVSGAVEAQPFVDVLSTQTFTDGDNTMLIHFTGNAVTYTWTNDNPAIGLPSAGSGDIPSFAAVNNGLTVLTANITVIPSSTSCIGNSITFKININPTIPSLTLGTASGSIMACQGLSSVSPDIQQFAVAGTNLNGDVQITAPSNFEVSFNPNTGYASTLILKQTAGKVNSTDIYVRSAFTAPAGHISGNVILSSAGVTDQNVPVSGEVMALPTVDALSAQTFDNGASTTPINFTGTASIYTWTNDNPSIGLPSGGSGDIPAFTAINNGQTVLAATITVVPSDALCTGNSITFKININPTPPSLTVGAISGGITACLGLPSASPDIQQFSVTGSGLGNDVQITAPANFEISLNPGAGYTNTLTLAQIAGKVTSTNIYVRSSASAPVGNNSGIVAISSAGAPGKTVNVSGTINALPMVNPISPLTFNNGSVTTAINFGGSPAAIYTWMNDTQGIGLQAGGTGNIPSFTAINNTTNPITATITVVPSNGSCTGSPVVFKITVNPTLVPVISFAGNLSPLNTTYGSASASGSFSVSGNNLISAVTITPPAGFEVSADGVNFKNTTTIGGSGTLTATTVYIRLAKTTFAGNYVGNIVLNTNGAANSLAMPNSIVTPASMIITADNKTRSLHSENPLLTVTYNGFVNNENELNLVKKPEVVTVATPASAAGGYTISFTSGAESPNYSFTYITGILTVTPSGVVVFNTFTPNGDGMNDTWAIKYIEYYPNCTVNVFNRWGAKVFSSMGYSQQWDGRLSGNPVPTGTYYYVINLKDGSPPKSGWIAIAR
ncbi:gliding motility-associated C-terminal domain-containing protein [Mucilaginibacter sp. cycad4]|uniref:T9SS type B sorting domain-containing protein n=1 Tax=Mucilaginibacter sp. cycad4 TaxID=3342096 RepID=UPI002AAA7C93|nr:gliding motility-associated C-terminal domain-containing protein [Mucilaginibacter gossypii]WPV01114.1 gliding motility-associated C-terminal domain-containing protein [Mucilaginibacter gossypii]